MADARKLTLSFEPGDQKQFGPCECCGTMSTRVWGYVYRDEIPLAVYFVDWTAGHRGEGAIFSLALGPWEEDSIPANRFAAVLRHFCPEDQPGGFQVLDAPETSAVSSLASNLLARSDVIGTAWADMVFAVCDAIVLGDSRIGEILCRE